MVITWRLGIMDYQRITFPTGSDFTHDLQYDFFGRQLAVALGNGAIKVLVREGGRWQEHTQLHAHSGPVFRVTWAHPEFGQVLASCSEDKVVHVWQQQEGLQHRDGSSPGRWQKLASLVDALESVTDIEFAPSHLGLKLASASGDGYVRVYEAADVTNITYWTLQERFQPAAERGVSSLSWNESRFDPPQLLLGLTDGAVQIWTYNDTHRRWQQHLEVARGGADTVHDVAWAPCMGRSFHLLAAAGKRGLKIWRVDGGERVREESCGEETGGELWRVRWNLTGTVLVTTGDDAAVRMWRRAGASALAAAHGGPVAEWQCVKRLTAESAGAVGMDMDVPLSPAAEAWSAARGGEGAD